MIQNTSRHWVRQFLRDCKVATRMLSGWCRWRKNNFALQSCHVVYLLNCFLICMNFFLSGVHFSIRFFLQGWLFSYDPFWRPPQMKVIILSWFFSCAVIAVALYVYMRPKHECFVLWKFTCKLIDDRSFNRNVFLFWHVRRIQMLYMSLIYVLWIHYAVTR